MKSTINSSEGLNRKLSIEVPMDVVQKAFIKVYEGIQKQAAIKGFRKGKAPLNVIKSTYGDKAHQDVMQDLVSQGYQSALQEHSLNPINHPNIQIDQFGEDQEFKFTAEIEVRPEVKVNKFEGLKVEKEILEIDETKIDEVLTNIQRSFQTTSPVLEDRPAKDGDVANINFDGYIDGKPLEGGKADGHDLELGTNSFIPGFEEGVAGMKPGDEKEINLKFPEDYHAKDIAGKDVVFKTKLNELKKKELPELNDELAAKLGDKYKTMEELKTAIRNDLKEGEEKRIVEDLKNRILKVLVDSNPVDVPQSLQQEQEQRLKADISQKLQQQGMTPDQIEEYKEKWQSDFEKQASNMIQSSFLIDAIAKEINYEPTQKDVDAKVEAMAKEMNIDPAQVKEYYQKPEQQTQLKYQLVEDNVIAHLIDKAEIKEVAKDKLKDLNK